MDWLDQVLAVPILGIHTAPFYRTGSELFSALRPLMERWSDEQGELFIEQAGPMAAKISRSDGFSVDIIPEQVLASFAYKGVIREVPGEVARLSYAFPTTPYSTLLQKTLGYLQDVLDATSGGGTRTMKRVGLVADCRMEQGSTPPGFEALRQHLGRPWGTSLVIVNAALTADLKNDSAGIDRCHHTLDVNEVDRPKDFRLRLDWQRLPTPPVPLRKGDNKVIQKAVSDAMSYFVRFAAGELDYATHA